MSSAGHRLPQAIPIRTQRQAISNSDRGLPGTIVSTGGNAANSLHVQASETAATEAGAIAGDDFDFFTVTPGALDLDLTSLTFDVAASGAAGASTTAVRSSIDNFAANIGTVAQSGTAFTPGSFAPERRRVSKSHQPDHVPPIRFRQFRRRNDSV